MFSLFTGIASWWVARQKARAEMKVAVSKFLLENFKWIVPLILCILLALFVRGVMNERDHAIERAKTAENALKIYKQEVQQEAELQQAKVAQLREEGKRNVAKIEANHIKDIQHIAKQYGKVIQNDQKAINNYRIELSNRLREQTTSDDSSRVSENDANTITRDNCDTTAIRTLKEAAKVCTKDYNACFQYIKKEQARIGVYTHEELNNQGIE